jgi:hypothetical protein
MVVQADLMSNIMLLPALQREPLGDRLLNGLVVLILLIVSAVCLTALLTLLAALLPGYSSRSHTALLRSPWRAFFIGLANYLFLGGIGLVLVNIEPIALLGLLILAFLVGVTLIGMVGLVSLLGERLAGLRGQAFSAWQRLLWGSVTLILACLLPIVGWFLLLPIVQMISFGAAVLAWRHRRQPETWE